MSTLEQKSGDSQGTLITFFLSHFLVMEAICCPHQGIARFDSGTRKLVLSSASSLATRMPPSLLLWKALGTIQRSGRLLPLLLRSVSACANGDGDGDSDI